MNKRGQFYLLAAIIIVALIMGLATGTNKAERTGIDKTKSYELFVDVNIDTVKMINYNPSTTTGYSPDDLKRILDEFSEIYSSVDVIYIIIQKDNEKGYYVYENGDLGVLSEGSDKTELESYNFQNAEYYALIIKEKNGNQYVIFRVNG